MHETRINEHQGLTKAPLLDKKEETTLRCSTYRHLDPRGSQEVSGKRDPELLLRVALGSQALKLLGLSSFADPSGVPRIQGSLLAFLEGRQGARSCHLINLLTQVCPCKGSCPTLPSRFSAGKDRIWAAPHFPQCLPPLPA